MAFLGSEIADFEAILAFSIQFFTYIPLYWPYMMMRYVGGPPYVPLQGPWVIKMSILAIFLNPRRSKIGQISQIHGFFCV